MDSVGVGGLGIGHLRSQGLERFAEVGAPVDAVDAAGDGGPFENEAGRGWPDGGKPEDGGRVGGIGAGNVFAHVVESVAIAVDPRHRRIGAEEVEGFPGVRQAIRIDIAGHRHADNNAVVATGAVHGVGIAVLRKGYAGFQILETFPEPRCPEHIVDPVDCGVPADGEMRAPVDLNGETGGRVGGIHATDVFIEVGLPVEVIVVAGVSIGMVR